MYLRRLVYALPYISSISEERCQKFPLISRKTYPELCQIRKPPDWLYLLYRKSMLKMKKPAIVVKEAP